MFYEKQQLVEYLRCFNEGTLLRERELPALSVADLYKGRTNSQKKSTYMYFSYCSAPSAEGFESEILKTLRFYVGNL